MLGNAINGDGTVADGGKDVTLAGRYHILRQLGEGGTCLGMWYNKGHSESSWECETT